MNSRVFKNMFLINPLRYSEGISAMLELPKNFIAAAMDKEIGNTFPIKRVKKKVVFSTNMKRFNLTGLAKAVMLLANLNFKALLSQLVIVYIRVRAGKWMIWSCFWRSSDI